jgi:hypothetical protein
MKTESEIWHLFSDRKFIGSILRHTTLLEFELNGLLAQYFIRSDRYEEAMELLLPELSFGRKIDLFKRLPIRKSLKSYQTAISGLRRFQRIRNIVAHTPHISRSRSKEFTKDGNYKRILHDYPEGTLDEFRNTSRSLTRLLRVKEFINPNTEEVLEPMMIWLDNWLR